MCLRQVCVPCYKLIALKLFESWSENRIYRLPPGPKGKLYTRFQFDTCNTFELSHRNGYLIEFDLCDLCDLENQGHDPKIYRLPQGPREKLYTRFQVDS